MQHFKIHTMYIAYHFIVCVYLSTNCLPFHTYSLLPIGWTLEAYVISSNFFRHNLHISLLGLNPKINFRHSCKTLINQVTLPYPFFFFFSHFKFLQYFGALDKFSDKSDIAEWAKEHVASINRHTSKRARNMRKRHPVHRRSDVRFRIFCRNGDIQQYLPYRYQ